MEARDEASGPVPRREDFAAEVLELGAVLEILAREAASSLGVRVLAELGPRPLEEVPAALARQREMAVLVATGAVPPLAGTTDPLALAAGSRGLGEQELALLRGFCEAAGRVAAWFAERSDEAPALAALTAGLPDLAPLRDEIDRVLDGRGRVRDDASALLERLRRDLARLARSVDVRMREVMARADVRAVLSDGSVHRRGGRPVLAVRAKSAGRVKGIVHDRSQSEQSVFVEPREVIELGNRLAEARADERRELERVLLELVTRVRARRPELVEAARVVGEVEVALAGARWAARVGARAARTPGEVGAATGLLLRAARHPLLVEGLERGRLPEVVPIDLRLGDEFDVLVITGPNTGGKTLALKTAGLFALMTRAGLPVPAAEGTTVPLYDAVLADIGDEQEIRQNLSTFASHLVRIRDALERAGPRTLVLLDELGGGTDPDEGAALGGAVLETLLARRVPTLASTHLGRLKEFAFRRARVENASTEFDIETLAPRYRLLVGTPGVSGALAIADRLGLPSEVVELARERAVQREGELARLFEDVRHARQAAEHVRSRAERQLERAEAVRRSVEGQEAELARRGDLLEREAQRGLEERVRDARRRLEEARALLPQMPRETAARMAERLDALEADLTGATLSERRKAFLDGLRKGSLVYLPRYRQRVIVQKVDGTRRQVTVQLGKMRMNVPFEEVSLYESL